ncbi:MAG: plastocyanin/azurin family copper-binding protein [Haloarculaceae archaeon]
MTPTTHDGDHGRTATAGDDDPDRADERTATGREESTRRRVLAALGAACLPAVAGCASESTTGAAPGTTAAGVASGDPTTRGAEPTANETRTGSETGTGTGTGAAEGDAIDPRFGFVGARGESPPVEPDHTVSLEIRPREGVPIPEFYFEPTGLAVGVGDTVRFDLATPHHNVNAYHPAFGYTQRVPDGTPAYSSPVLAAGEYWLYTFRAGGVHDLMCSPHELFGMVGRVVVDAPTGPAASPVGEAPGGKRARSPEFTAGRVLSAPALRPERILDRGAVPWADVAEERKRPLLRPVEE